MSISSFIKENRVLAAGLVLPLLLIALLAFAKTLPEKMIDPPKSKLVYFSRGWAPKGRINFSVNAEGKLVAAYTAPKNLVYVYNPTKNLVEEYPVTLNDKDEPVMPEALTSLLLSSKQPSADGYTFEPYHYRSHSMITEIFSTHSYNQSGVISKDERIISLPQPKTYMGSLEFLGWETSTTAGGQ